MSGVLAALGIRDARRVVERAAVPMLRREWHRLDLADGTPEDVALAYAGETGGTCRDPVSGAVCAFDGELVTETGVVSGTDAAGMLLSAWQQAKSSFTPPEGSFAACIWDPPGERLIAVTDRFGRVPLYWTRHQGGVLVAGELKGLIAAGVQPRIDLQAWAELLAFEHLFTGTPLEGAQRVAGGNVVRLDRKGEESEERYWRFELEPAALEDEGTWVASFRDRLEASVARSLTPDAVLGLSGGLDSRCAAVAAVAQRLFPATVTYGAHGSIDLELGEDVGRRTGLSNRLLVLEPGYLARGATETVWLSEGHIRCLHAHHLVLRALRSAADCRSILMGFSGDWGVRTGNATYLFENPDVETVYRARANCIDDELRERLLAPAFAAELRDRARAGFVAAFERETGPPGHRFHQLVYNALPVKIWPGAQLFKDDLAGRDPYGDYAVIDFLQRLPHELRRDGRLQRAYLRAFSDLGGLPDAKDSVRRSLARRLGRRRNRGTLGDYGTDLDGPSRPLLDVLLEDRTFERGQLRRQEVRAFVERGDSRRTRALGMLLTFELFQRQFVDGDGFART
ncbi:MAG TPA: asparagine synthase-related protein [Gaiellaceae bacterium]